MRVNGTAIRIARGTTPQTEVSQEMRGVMFHRAPPGTRVRGPGQISAWERGTEEPTEYQATVLAAVLGVGLSEILASTDPDVLAAHLSDDLAAIRVWLDIIARAIGGPALNSLERQQT
jgi:hypothetical protein